MNDPVANLIALIYEGPSESNPWQNFATAMRTCLTARYVVITLHHAEDEQRDEYLVAGPENDPIDWDAVEARYRADFMKGDHYRPSRMVPGDIGLTVFAELPDSIRDYMEELGLAHDMRCCFAEPGGIHCWIDVIRTEVEQPFTQEEQELMRSLLPHLDRALALYAKLKGQESEKAIYETMMDHFALGCIMLNKDGEVIHLNRIATALIGQWPGISIFRDSITLSDQQTQHTLNAAINAVTAAQFNGNGHNGGELIRLGGCESRLLGLLVYPAPPQPYYRGGQAPRAVVYLSDLTANLEALQPARDQTLERICKLFDLTRQESTLALLLAYGHTISEAASEMAIAEISARNYSKKIYAKMGVTGQTDLIRMVLRSISFLL